jgi:DNA polymerase-3 subunit delta
MSDAPILYLLQGDDELAIRDFIQAMQDKMGAPSTAEMNTDRINGRQLNVSALKNVAFAMPFLAERRLVIVENGVRTLRTKAAQEKMVALLETLPVSTALVLVESKPLSEKNWLVKWVANANGRAYVRTFELPKGPGMARWIRAYAKKQGGLFDPEAAMMLSGMVMDDTRVAANEVDKLLAYVNWERDVEPADIDRLTAEVPQGDVFRMVDAIGNRNGKLALDMLHQLLAEQDALPLFGMIVRQYRLLLQARELQDGGATQVEMSKEIGTPLFVVRKLTGQLRNLDLPTLERIYKKLLEIDENIKTGQTDPVVALDTLIASLTG